MRFKHITVDQQTPGLENDVCLIADVDGNGYNDIIIGGKKGTGNLVWYEYPSWRRHTIGTANLEAGGVTLDITGNGLPDIVAGQPFGGRELYWFENPGSPDVKWPKRLIDDEFNKYHDQAIGDIDSDGEKEIIVLSQVARLLVYYDIPPDPRVSPWPKEYRHIIYDDFVAEGLAIADLDGDGQMEIIAGPNWFKAIGDPKQGWERHIISSEFDLTRVAVGDINGDGKLDVVLSEGERTPARLAWFSDFPNWKMHLLADDLFHLHSLALADFNGDGRLDIFVGEMGLGKNPRAKLLVYLNKGAGIFEKHLIDDTYPTHDAKVGDIGRSGRISIIGKPYDPGQCVDLWLNEP